MIKLKNSAETRAEVLREDIALMDAERATGGIYDASAGYVLAYVPDGHDPFVTWAVWNYPNETGELYVANAGNYHRTIEDAERDYDERRASVSLRLTEAMEALTKAEAAAAAHERQDARRAQRRRIPS